MKVQCDVCEAETASIFCCADEAALCDACDRRVHSANKLAGKHRRLSLLHPSTSSSSAQKPPLCDICQEKRGFLFCKEDRAILCRDCDVKVHTASELTRRHSRFLLTGVRVSSAPANTPAASEDEEENRSTSPCNADSASGARAGSATASASDGSSISEYLTKTLPGWHVEDFLLDDTAALSAVAVSSHEAYEQGGLVAAQNIGGRQQQGYPACARREQQLLRGDVGVNAGELWVPQMHAGWTGGSKRPRASHPCAYCDFSCPVDPNGNIIVHWDFVSIDTVYTVMVSVHNYQLYRHIERPGWRLSWAWAGKEVIWDTAGSETTEQGNCTGIHANGAAPHCCEKQPVMVDLPPGAPYNKQVANCCRGGVLSSLTQNNRTSTSAFQMYVGNFVLDSDGRLRLLDIPLGQWPTSEGNCTISLQDVLG